MVVKSIDVHSVKVQIKKCPIEVQQYISSLENLLEISQETTRKAIKKLKDNAKKIS